MAKSERDKAIEASREAERQIREALKKPGARWERVEGDHHDPWVGHDKPTLEAIADLVGRERFAEFIDAHLVTAQADREKIMQASFAYAVEETFKETGVRVDSRESVTAIYSDAMADLRTSLPPWWDGVEDFLTAWERTKGNQEPERVTRVAYVRIVEGKAYRGVAGLLANDSIEGVTASLVEAEERRREVTELSLQKRFACIIRETERLKLLVGYDTGTFYRLRDKAATQREHPEVVKMIEARARVARESDRADFELTTPDLFLNSPVTALSTHEVVVGATRFATNPTSDLAENKLKQAWEPTLTQPHLRSRGDKGLIYYLQDRKKERPLSITDSQALFDLAREGNRPVTNARAVLYLTAALTSARPGEIVRLRPEQVAKALGAQGRMEKGNFTWADVSEAMEKTMFGFVSRMAFMEIIDVNRRTGAFTYREGGRIFDIEERSIVQANMYTGVEKMRVPYIDVRWGTWADEVKGGVRKQTGWLPENIFNYDPRKLESQLSVAFSALQFLNYNRRDDPRKEIYELFRWIFTEDELNEKLGDRRKAHPLRSQFVNALFQLTRDGWHIVYSDDYPDVLRPTRNSEGKVQRPKGTVTRDVMDKLLSAKIGASPPSRPVGPAPTQPDLQNSLTGDRLRSLREKEGYTQRALAEALGVTQPLVSQWERGKRDINEDDKKKIRDLLGE